MSHTPAEGLRQTVQKYRSANEQFQSALESAHRKLFGWKLATIALAVIELANLVLHHA